MIKEKLHTDHIRAVLSYERRQIQELLDAIELNDVSRDTVVHQIRRIEDNLRRIRIAA